MPKATNDSTNLKNKKAKTTTKSKQKTTSNVAKVKTTAKSKKTNSLANSKKPLKANSKNTKKNTKTKKSSSVKKNTIQLIEYYDLPYRYNETVVKILAQTPNTLFVYWDISDADKENYIKKYGSNFFETTAPFLIIHNKTLNYYFEIQINDFANSWYFTVNDAKCDYEIELIRKELITNSNSIPIATSNSIESPNDHILFENIGNTILFKNIKNNSNSYRNLKDFNLQKNCAKIYNIYEIYKKLYKDDELLSIQNMSSSNFLTKKEIQNG